MLNLLHDEMVTDANSERFDQLGYTDGMSESHGSWGLGSSIARYSLNLARKEIAARRSFDCSPTQIQIWDRPVSSVGQAVFVGFPADVKCAHLLVYSSMFGSSPGMMVQIDPDWLVIAYKARDELALSDIEVIVDGLTRFLSSERFAEVDMDLERADPFRMSADAIVTIAHMTYPARFNLHAWEGFVKRSCAVFTERGDDEGHLEGLV